VDQKKIIGALMFGLGALGAAAIAWAVLGSKTDAVVLRAIASTTFSGAVIGTIVSTRLHTRAPRSVARTGLLTGLLLHPVTWFVYVIWGVLVPTSAEGVGGNVLVALENALLWTAASIPHGAALTIPVCLLAAFGFARVAKLPALD
jgi:hypothetical protein